MLHRERLRLEDAIRARALRATTGQQRRAVAFDADTLLSALGPARLVELVAVDGDLHVLVCGDGRIRRRAAGALADAAREVDFARFGLNRIARGHLAEPPEQALAALVAGGRRLDALLLGAARDQLGDGPAHIAAHGVFRADSPLFCSLRLDDGPMTVHDVGRLRRAPYRLILPSCESALLAPAGADELLGLASALLPLGTAGLVASVAQVSDRAAAPLMLALHRRLRAAGPGPSGPGGPGALAAALRDARSDACQATADDPVVTAAGWSFIALGA
jgi:hypothetical protein